MELTKEEKMAIINQHYKASVENAFDIQLRIIEENASPTPNQDTINALNNNLNIEIAKQKALNDQIALLQNN
jgi:hypothetical protein